MHFYDLVRQATLKTGTGGPITLDASVVGFKTFIEAGVVDGSVVHYSIENPGTSVTGRETCWGVYSYNSGAPSITRNTISSTSISPANVAITLVAGAQITITPYSEDLESLFYDTYAAVQAAVIATNINVIETRGRVSVGDNGGGRYYRVSAQPSHTGKVQSLDGAWFELAPDQWITPEQFGAIGDASVATSPTPTNNTTIFKNIATYVLAKVPFGCRMKGKQGAIYGVWPGTPADQDVIFDLRASVSPAVGVRDFVWDFNGSQVRALGSWTASTVGYFFYANDFNGITLRSPNFYDTQKATTTFASGGTEYTYGPQWIVFDTTSSIDSENALITDLVILGGRIGIYCVRNAGITGRVRGISIIGMRAQSVYYPLNFQKNGDNFFGRNIYLSGCGRDYFPYNVGGHDVEITSDNDGIIIPTIDMGCITDSTETVSQNTTGPIKLSYRLENKSGVMTTGALMGLAFLQGTAITSAGVIKDIDVRMNIPLPASVGSSGTVFTTTKTTFAGAVDNTGRGYFLDNIRISGKMQANGNNYSAVNLFNDSIWSGETIRNVCVEKLTIDGKAGISGVNISGGGANESSPIICRDIQITTGDFTIASTQAKFSLYNIRSANYNTSGLVTMTWSQTSGTQPVIGNGTITCHYNREGRKVTVTATIIFGSSSTYGNNGTQYRFVLPSPYDHSPAGNLDYLGPVYSINAGGLKTGVVLWPSGSASMYIGRDGTTAFWRLDNPGIWTTADLIEFTVTADV